MKFLCKFSETRHFRSEVLGKLETLTNGLISKSCMPLCDQTRHSAALRKESDIFELKHALTASEIAFRFESREVEVI